MPATIPDDTVADRSSSTDPGQRPSIDGYRIIGEIASGGMATVYLAQCTANGCAQPLVAIKYCHPHLRRDPVFANMFLDEARLASLIHHPNVVATTGVGDAQSLFFAMQYIEGGSLADWLTRLETVGKRLPVPILLRIVVDALSGIEAAHCLNDASGKPMHLIHRDVSPQNILIGTDGIARIGDFGIAKAEARITRTRTGQVKGKTGYMAPEQILLEPLERSTDLYAVGVVLWEALTGQRLFDGDSDAATINLVLNTRISPPSKICGSDERLDALVLQALAFRPSDRYASAAEFAARIQDLGLETANAEVVGKSVAEIFAEDIRLRRSLLAAHGECTGDGGTDRSSTSIHLDQVQPDREKARSPRTNKPRWRLAVVSILTLIAGSWGLFSVRLRPEPPAPTSVGSAQVITFAPSDPNGKSPTVAATPSTSEARPYAPADLSTSRTTSIRVGAARRLRPAAKSPLTGKPTSSREMSPAPPMASANLRPTHSAPSEYRPNEL